jgi:transaldolase/glucose-6-phosphate isomerase
VSEHARAPIAPVCLTGRCAGDAARHETWQALRGAVRNRLKVATTLGYGPRYLHSTGPLHKGGPNTGVFIVFTADAVEDIPIPGQPYGFAVLQRAQALGDFLALSHK